MRHKEGQERTAACVVKPAALGVGAGLISLDEIAQAEGPRTLTGEADLDHSLTKVLDRYDDVDLPVEAVHDAWHAIEVHEDVLDGVRSLAGRGVIRALTTNQNGNEAASRYAVGRGCQPPRASDAPSTVAPRVASSVPGTISAR